MFEILTFLQKIFGGGGSPKEDSRSAARDRLRLVLVSDRATVAPHLMESLRNDLIEVISRYMEIDVRAMQMGLERHDGAMALAANIPVRSVHRSSAEMPAVRAAAAPAPQAQSATAVMERPAPAPAPAAQAPATPPRPSAPPHLSKPAVIEESQEEFSFESAEGGVGKLNPRRRTRKKSRRRSSEA